MNLQSETWNQVTSEENDIRIDVFSARTFSLSRARVQKLIEDQFVKCNGQIVKANYKIHIGDQIELFFPEPKTIDLKPQEIPLEVLYQDDHLAVINKPAGMVVHPAPGHWEGTLVNALLHHMGKDLGKATGIGGELRPGIVHRIDRNTSGILLITKTDLAHHSLSEQFRIHSISRRYLALCWGGLPKAGEWQGAIGRDPKDRKKMALVEKGKSALTHFSLVESFGAQLSFFEANLLTGRTHQIRVHASAHGFPLVGDVTYTEKRSLKEKKEKGLSWIRKNCPEILPNVEKLQQENRQFLHAAHLGFDHPVSQQRMEFQTALPEDLKQIVTGLRLCQK